MKINSPTSLIRRHLLVAATLATALCTLGSVAVRAAITPALLDNFADPQHTPAGAGRFLVDDNAAGSHSHATQHCANGVLTVEGELVPGRGVPAFVSVPLLLSPDAKPRDLTGYEGVRLRIKVTKGIIILQVASAEVQNFDFHASAPLAGTRGEFQEVRIPFKDLKRAWSEQTALNLKTITSVNLVAFGMAPGTFTYEVKEVGFY
ncbi:MAG TPA: CIA30 family protein [Terracidiphilus sp.]|nr:CIA30 family protein [Terracidiphilus sp.]